MTATRGRSVVVAFSGMASPVPRSCDCPVCKSLPRPPKDEDSLLAFKKMLETGQHSWTSQQWAGFLLKHFPDEYRSQPVGFGPIVSSTRTSRVDAMRERFSRHEELFHPSDKLPDKMGVVIKVLRNGRIVELVSHEMGGEDAKETGENDGS